VTDPGAKDSVLIVEDDRALRSACATFLERLGYQVIQAETGERALELLVTHRLSAMLCDIRMSGISGIDLLPRALASDSDLAIIMLTGVDEPAAAISCLKLGAADYLIKPVDLEELQHSLQSALRKRALEIERRGLEQWLAREVALRTQELEQQSRQLSRLSVNVLAALVDALEAKDPVLRGHSQRVADLSGRIATRLSLAAEEVEAVRTSGRLHDIGKLALREPGLDLGASTSDEIASLRDDPDLALRLLAPLAHLTGVAEVVRHQHERYDGKGVPEGRRGDEIPLGSRIVAAASLYDELAVASPDGSTLEPREAIANLRGVVGLMLDPRVFGALEQEVAAAT
jgi:response regulator RpfG family c-di-GMP phosphodiesterase